MRKRSRYRPKPVRHDVMDWILNSRERVLDDPAKAVQIKLIHRLALEALRTGQASDHDIKQLIDVLNTAKALSRMAIGSAWASEIDHAIDALHSLGQRDRYIATGPELTAISEAIEIHHAQLDVCTVADIEQAVQIVIGDLRRGAFRTLAKKDTS